MKQLRHRRIYISLGKNQHPLQNSGIFLSLNKDYSYFSGTKDKTLKMRVEFNVNLMVAGKKSVIEKAAKQIYSLSSEISLIWYKNGLL